MLGKNFKKSTKTDDSDKEHFRTMKTKKFKKVEKKISPIVTKKNIFHINIIYIIQNKPCGRATTLKIPRFWIRLTIEWKRDE
jgi:hypothetical protein